MILIKVMVRLLSPVFAMPGMSSFFTDGDNQFHMSEIELLLKKIGEADGVFGFRKNRKDPWHKIWYSRLWNWLVRVMFDRRVKDLNCAFKIAHTKYLV